MVSLSHKGANLGWPEIWMCQQRHGMITPLLVWESAMPPGGGGVYRGQGIPTWTGSFLIGTLVSEHLHQVRVSGADQPATAGAEHFVYLKDTHGRLRAAVTGPDGALYVTTSNCDGRGTCSRQKDVILRITQKP
jgi:glucose/arabinose dehydrogenase